MQNLTGSQCNCFRIGTEQLKRGAVAMATADPILFGRFRAGRNQKLTSFCCFAQPNHAGNLATICHANLTAQRERSFASTSHFRRLIGPGGHSLLQVALHNLTGQDSEKKD